MRPLLRNRHGRDDGRSGRERDRVSDADLIELRLDSVSDPDVAGALAGRKRPVIVTCRPVWEGGEFTGSEDARRRILGEALALGADYVDVEWRAGFDDLISLTGGRRIVLSMHDYKSMRAISARAPGRWRATGAEIIKIAGDGEQLSDCVRLMDLGAAHGIRGAWADSRCCERGLPPRVLAGRFGFALGKYAGAIRASDSLTRPRCSRIVPVPLNHRIDRCLRRGRFAGQRIRSHRRCTTPRSAPPVWTRVSAAWRAVDTTNSRHLPRAIGTQGRERDDSRSRSGVRARRRGVRVLPRRIGAINTIRMVNGRWLVEIPTRADFCGPLQDRHVAAAAACARRFSARWGSAGRSRSRSHRAASTVRVHARRSGARRAGRDDRSGRGVNGLGT